jgi:hypothetical protein
MVKSKKVYMQSRPTKYRQPQIQGRKDKNTQGMPPRKDDKDERSTPVSNTSLAWERTRHVLEDIGATIQENNDHAAIDNQQIDPEIQLIGDLIHEGNLLALMGSSIKSAEKYLKSWILIKKSIHEHDDSWCTVDYLLSSVDVDIIEYCYDFMMELQNAGLENEIYFPKVIDTGYEIMKFLDVTEKSKFAFTMKRYIAETQFHTEDAKTGNEHFENLIKEYPNIIWGYIYWGDQLAVDSMDPCHDYSKAEMLYQKALNLMIQKDMKEYENLTIRFKDLYELAGTPEKLDPIVQKMKSISRAKKGLDVDVDGCRFGFRNRRQL